jgi:hypothetical protein
MSKRAQNAKKAGGSPKMSPSKRGRAAMQPDAMLDERNARRRAADIKRAIPMRGHRPARPFEDD